MSGPIQHRENTNPEPPRASIACAVALACAAERDKLGRKLTDAEHGCIRAGYHAGLSRGWVAPRPLYTVRWRRLSPAQPGAFSPPTDAAPLECVHLRERDLVRRLIGAIENSGPVLIEAVDREAVGGDGGPPAGSVPRSGIAHEVYVHCHHALRALQRSGTLHPDDKGIAAARERLGVALVGLRMWNEVEGEEP